ncbi:MAG: hypothetical protein A2176_09965 [Spirochaetes bacterium RBG_13_51_14]|nr:MAG: hypothetical protein A2176_09965 [Spirochaetes bacterium RBG_13_51_14]
MKEYTISPRRSRMVLSVVLASFLTFQMTDCFIEEKPKEKNIEQKPPTPDAEAERKTRDKRIETEREALSAWMRANTWYPIVPAAAAVVVENDAVVFRETVRCEPTKPFMVASLTKTFTMLSILQLVDRGIISLDDPISKYLHVDFENSELASKPISIWHLLTHTSGLVEDPNPKLAENNYPFIVPEQKYPTGFRFNYCNQGYNLLGFIVFEASGLSLGDYVTRNILVPLEMRDSMAPVTTRGAAGVECSLNDLTKYIFMFMQGGEFKGRRIVSRRMFRKILEESVEGPSSKYKEYRGICFRIWSVNGRIYSMHHAAHMPGAGGFMQLFPRHRCGYVFISNPPVYDREEFYGYYYGLKSRLMQFCKVLMNDTFDPVSFQPDRPTVKQLRRFVGRYRNENNDTYVDIELHPSGYLVAVKSYTGQRCMITPTSLHTFVYIYPGQSEKGEIYDFVMKRGMVIGLGVKEGYFVR